MAIVCSCDESYLPHLSTMLQTFAETNDVGKYELYLLSSGLKKTSLRKFRSHVRGLGLPLVEVPVDAEIFAAFPVSGHVSIASYYRLAIPSLLPQDIAKALYIDADTCVTGNLEEAWQLPIDGYSLAAVESPNHPEWDRSRLELPATSKYFNAGIMMLNLEKLRHADLIRRSADYLQRYNERVLWWDQDLLNALLHDDWLELPLVWNYTDIHKVLGRSGLSIDYPNLDGKVVRNAILIVHFCGGGWAKPWHVNCASPYRRIYRDARAKTPWSRYSLTGAPSLSEKLRKTISGLIRWLLRSLQLRR